jgi:hypothetical protein
MSDVDQFAAGVAKISQNRTGGWERSLVCAFLAIGYLQAAHLIALMTGK